MRAFNARSEKCPGSHRLWLQHRLSGLRRYRLDRRKVDMAR